MTSERPSTDVVILQAGSGTQSSATQRVPRLRKPNDAPV
jgi:hypothetical protein